MSPEIKSSEQQELSPEQQRIAELEARVATLEEEKLNDKQTIADRDATIIKITEERKEAIELSTKDALLGTYNRRGLKEVTEVLLKLRGANVERGSKQKDVAVIIIDIDNFKSINDTYGHDEGDRILRETVKHLEGILRPGDIIARWGGEEFVIVCYGVDEETIAKAFYDRTQGKSSIPFKTDLGGEKDREITFSGGVTMFKPGESADDLEKVIARADVAQYVSKKTPGKDRLTIFTDEMKKEPRSETPEDLSLNRDQA